MSIEQRWQEMASEYAVLARAYCVMGKMDLAQRCERFVTQYRQMARKARAYAETQV